MKALLIFLLIFPFLNLIGQPQNIPLPDWQFSKSYIVAECGVSSYTRSPVMGLMFSKEFEDDKKPFVVLWRSGLLLTPRADPDKVFIVQTGFAVHINKKIDVGCFPIYFIGYFPRTEYKTPIALYANIHKTDKFCLRVEASYFWGHRTMGAQATLNYKLKHLKEI